jgi:hypothetical protein
VSSLAHNLIVFGRLLRRVGIDVPVGSLLDLFEALTTIELARRDQVFHACRAMLVSHHDQLAVFERVFDAFWCDRGNPFIERQRDGRNEGAAPAVLAAALLETANRVGDVQDSNQAPSGTIRGWSDRPAFVEKDFAEFSAEDMARAREALDHLSWSPGLCRTRRWVRGRGTRLDLRRALAEGLRTGGELVTIPKRQRRVRPRPLVLLCDVSGSMDRYSRMLVHFAHAMGKRHSLELFLFSTGLTRVTRQIRRRRLNEAASAVADAVPDWSGGTRIGQALLQFHQQWSRRVLHHGPVVLLVSDGWDRGDPGVLRDQVARLQRSCHRLIWLNPLIGTIDYEPLTRGLQAALPFVDDFLPARTLADLRDLAIHLDTVSSGRRSRRRPRPDGHLRHLHV